MAVIMLENIAKWTPNLPVGTKWCASRNSAAFSSNQKSTLFFWTRPVRMLTGMFWIQYLKYFEKSVLNKGYNNQLHVKKKNYMCKTFWSKNLPNHLLNSMNWTPKVLLAIKFNFRCYAILIVPGVPVSYSWITFFSLPPPLYKERVKGI